MDTTEIMNHSRRSVARTNDNVQVYVRVRPQNSKDAKNVIEVRSKREIVARKQNVKQRFSFDCTFGQGAQQREIYQTVVAPHIDDVIKGYNCTVFAYGQTGTGKTHTMIGTDRAELKSTCDDNNEMGIIPRALIQLFDELRLRSGMEFSIRVSYMELYNEEIYDLLSNEENHRVPLRIFDDRGKEGARVLIKGLEEHTVYSKDDVYRLLEMGNERRSIAFTGMNMQSSRSHTVFAINLTTTELGADGVELLKIGKLNLVDLAGSENLQRAENCKYIRIRETKLVNRSLLTLGRVITALAECDAHVPYRDSKLTRLLQESLGGGTKTSIIATISPGNEDIDETLNTLKYAQRAKNIQNRPKINQIFKQRQEVDGCVSDLVDKLRAELKATQEKHGVYMPQHEYEIMQTKLHAQQRELNEKALLVKELREELHDMDDSLHAVNSTLHERTEEFKQMLSEIIPQATQLLNVANLATEDTTLLHETIDRRKALEENIMCVTDKFSKHMLENFSYIENNLRFMQLGCSSAAQMIHTEAGGCKELSEGLLQESSSSIEQLREVCVQSLANSSQRYETLLNNTYAASKEHRDELTALYKQFTCFEAEKFKEINEKLDSLAKLNDGQRAAIEQLHAKILRQSNESTAMVAARVRAMQDLLSQSLALIKQNSEQTEALNDELAERELEQKLLENLLEQLVAWKARNEAAITARRQRIQQLRPDIGSLAYQLKTLMQSTEDAKLEFGQQNDAAVQRMEEAVASALEQNLESDEHRLSAQSLLNDFVKSNEAEITKFGESHKSQLEYVRENVKLGVEHARSAQLAEAADIKTIQQHARTNLEITAHRLRVRLDYTLRLLVELNEHAFKYGDRCRNDVETCRYDLDHFMSKDLVFYMPSGATPTRRIFEYPRTLATDQFNISDLSPTVEPTGSPSTEFYMTAQSSGLLGSTTPPQRKSGSFQAAESARVRLISFSPLANIPDLLDATASPNAKSPVRDAAADAREH